MTELAKGTYKPTNKSTLAEYIGYWFETTQAQRLSAKTLDDYRSCAKHRIIPWIGKKKLRELSRADLESFYKKIVEIGNLENLAKPKDGEKPKPRKEVSKAVIEHHHRFIRRLLNHAVYEDEILERNVAMKITLPDPIQDEDYDPDDELVQVLTEEEITKLETELKNREEIPMFSHLVAVALRTGMRRGELLALKWDCINFEEKRLHIKRNVVYSPSTGCKFGPTKNKKRRIIEITDELVDTFRAIAALQQKYKDAIADNKRRLPYNEKANLVFTSDNGSLIHPDTVTKWFPLLCEEIGVTRLNFHCLRHSHASHLLASGEDISYVSKRLGHSSIQVTYNNYFHFIPMERRASLQELEKRFKKEVAADND